MVYPIAPGPKREMEFVTCEDGGMAEVRFHAKPKIGFKVGPVGNRSFAKIRAQIPKFPDEMITFLPFGKQLALGFDVELMLGWTKVGAKL